MITNLSKKLGLLLALTAAIPSVLAAETAKTAAAKPAEATAKAADPAIAITDSTVVAKITVDGKTIEVTLAQLKEQLKSLPANIQGAPFKEIYEALLQNAVNLSIITEKAKAQGLEKDAEVQRLVAGCQEAMLQKAFLERGVAKLQTPEELKKAYDEVIKILPKVDQVRMTQAIFKGDKEAEAKKFITTVKKDNNFEKALADAKASGKEIEGGDMDYIRMDALPPSIASEVTKAAKATLIPHPIAVELGGQKLYFVIRVNDKMPAPQPTYEQLEAELKQITFQKLAKTFLDQLIAGIKVEKTGLDGKPLVDKAPEAAAPAAATAAAPTPAPAAK